MADLGTPADVRKILDPIDSSSVTNDQIEDILDLDIKPLIETLIGQPLGKEEEVTRFYSGSNNNFILIDFRPIKELKSLKLNNSPIEVTSLILIPNEGMVKRENGIFGTGDLNIEAVFTHGLGVDAGSIPATIKRAGQYMAASATLKNISDEDGGATSLSVEGYSESFGGEGKFANLIKKYSLRGIGLLRPFRSGVVQ